MGKAGLLLCSPLAQQRSNDGLPHVPSRDAKIEPNIKVRESSDGDFGVEALLPKWVTVQKHGVIFLLALMCHSLCHGASDQITLPPPRPNPKYRQMLFCINTQNPTTKTAFFLHHFHDSTNRAGGTSLCQPCKCFG